MHASPDVFRLEVLEADELGVLPERRPDEVDWYREFIWMTRRGLITSSRCRPLHLEHDPRRGERAEGWPAVSSGRAGSGPLAGTPRPEFLPLTMDPLPRPPRRRSRQSLRLALLCGEFGGPVYGGVGVYTAHLAEALASRGHDVTRLPIADRPLPDQTGGLPDRRRAVRWDPVRERHLFLMALHREADRREFDLVESPLWAGNGAAVGSAARWPLVVRLETPFALIRRDVRDRIQSRRENLDRRRAAPARLRHGHHRDQRGGRLDGRIHLSRPAVVSRPTARGDSPGIALGGPHPVSTGRDAGCRRHEVPLHRPVRGTQRHARTGRGVCQGRPSRRQGDALARRCR